MVKLSQILDVDNAQLQQLMYGWPDRGRSVPMPPKEPLIYRLYEIVQNYGYAYKAVMNEKFGDGIMSAISFSTNVKKETDDKGDWVVITLRGKWYVERVLGRLAEADGDAGCHLLASDAPIERNCAWFVDVYILSDTISGIQLPIYIHLHPDPQCRIPFRGCWKDRTATLDHRTDIPAYLKHILLHILCTRLFQEFFANRRTSQSNLTFHMTLHHAVRRCYVWV